LKVLIASEGPDLSARVGERLGTSPYLLIVDIPSMETEVLPNPAASGQKGGGMQGVVLSIEKQVDAVLAGYCSPLAEKYLTSNGIRVYQGLRDSVASAIKQLEEGTPASQTAVSNQAAPERNSLRASFALTLRQFGVMIPLILGVVGLIGLFNTFVPRALIVSVFTGNKWLDTLLGAGFGSILAGNPISSYIIGGALLKNNVSLFGVTAFIVAWVSVGILQLPAEIGVLGRRFAVVRNLLSFLMAMGVAFLTVECLKIF